MPFPHQLEGKYCIVIEGPFGDDALYIDSRISSHGEFDDKSRAEEALAMLKKRQPNLNGKVMSLREFYESCIE